MTTLDAGAERAALHTTRPLAATILAELLSRATRAAAQVVSDGASPMPRPAARLAAAIDGQEATMRGPADVSFR